MGGKRAVVLAADQRIRYAALHQGRTADRGMLRQGRLVAGMNVGIRAVADTIAALIAPGRRFDSTTLTDPDVELAGLTEAG